MNHLSEYMPDSSQVTDILKSHLNKELEHLLDKALFHPLNEFFLTPGKNIRTKLVRIGYLLSCSTQPFVTDEIEQKFLQASAIVEMIHGGSLIVDDIQDGSLVRRNGPSLHIKHGVPLALNAGNWLYFWALCSVKNLRLDAQSNGEVLNDLLELMGEAHIGQALDLGIKIDELPQSLVLPTCLSSMELKTGTLLSLALRLGMGIADKNENRLEVLELGRNMGLVLQMCDDIGNFLSPPGCSKRHEDLFNRRPTWIWALASELPEDAYKGFLKAVAHLPDEKLMDSWIEQYNFLELLRKNSRKKSDELCLTWNTKWGHSHPEAVTLLCELKRILENSYVRKD